MKKENGKLAILGGKPVRKKKFPGYSPVGKEERDAVNRVMKRGTLSKYIGAWHPLFYGGEEVRAFEKEWSKYFNVKHAIAVNSCTSGLQTAVSALGISPGDEVIVSPYTMSASATAPLIYGGVPVFADVEKDYFCLDPDDVERKITPRTKAIIAVDIFGQPFDADKLCKVARKHNIPIIEDCAQAPGAKFKGKFAGTLGDIGVFSFNYHKHIHTGEGGMVVTDNDDIAERMRLIRNHAESVVGNKKEKNLVNMVGFNFRMTEIQAAIGREQLKKLRFLVEKRVANCRYIEKSLSALSGISPAKTREGATHVYYLQPFIFNEEAVGIGRDVFIEAVKAELPLTEKREEEGVRISSGYVRPLYLLPLFQKKIAIGKKGFPFNLLPHVNYSKGLCPNAERLHEKELFAHELMHSGMKKEDLEDLVKAFAKVYENRKLLLNAKK